MAHNTDFKDKIVLITGSARGIGAATAELIHQQGGTVVLHGQTESDNLKRLADKLHVSYVFCDVGNKIAVKAAVETVLEQHGRIDVLVNNAGVSPAEPFLEATDDYWMSMFQTNVLGVVNFCQALIPGMLVNDYGRIVNVASIRGHHSTSSNRIMAYSASKAAVLNLTSSLAKEFAPNIAVNAVSPGFTETDNTRFWNEATWKKVGMSLKGRIGQPAELAEAIAFLASDRASFITGQTLIVDGGYTISGK